MYYDCPSGIFRPSFTLKIHVVLIFQMKAFKPDTVEVFVFEWYVKV